MPIPLPNLDDRSYADLVEEMRALIPRYAPDWTDHNESDPGIMLIELFAWLTETLIYRLNRIPEASEVRFLELLGATFSKKDNVSGSADGTVDLEEIRAQTVTALKRRWRAITAEDFEELVLENSDLNIARVKCLPELDLEFSDLDTPRPGHVTVVVVPYPETDTPNAVEHVAKFLDERRLITCRHHVVGPGYTSVSIKTEVAGASQVRKERLKERIKKNLKEFFHPLNGGPDVGGKGWPFGRDVYASEVFQVIEDTDGVDHVEFLDLRTTNAEGDWFDAGDRIAIDLDNLVKYNPQKSDIKILDVL
jgi:hypothetical protein